MTGLFQNHSKEVPRCVDRGPVRRSLGAQQDHAGLARGVRAGQTDEVSRVEPQRQGSLRQGPGFAGTVPPLSRGKHGVHTWCNAWD